MLAASGPISSSGHALHSMAWLHKISFRLDGAIISSMDLAQIDNQPACSGGSTMGIQPYLDRGGRMES